MWCAACSKTIPDIISLWRHSTVARYFVQTSSAKCARKESHAGGGFRGTGLLPETVPPRTPTSFHRFAHGPKFRLLLKHLGLSAGCDSGAVLRQDRAKLRISVALAGTSLQEAQKSAWACQSMGPARRSVSLRGHSLSGLCIALQAETFANLLAIIHLASLQRKSRRTRNEERTCYDMRNFRFQV